jgi:hypothetical protein
MTEHSDKDNISCYLPGCSNTFRPKNTLHKFCSKECKKEWERRLYRAGRIFGSILLKGVEHRK